MPPNHDAGTATRHYRAFWQRRCRAAAAGAVLEPLGGNYAVLPILSQVAGHLLLLKSSNYSRLVSKEILCTEIQIVLFDNFNTKNSVVFPPFHITFPRFCLSSSMPTSALALFISTFAFLPIPPNPIVWSAVLIPNRIIRLIYAILFLGNTA